MNSSPQVRPDFCLMLGFLILFGLPCALWPAALIRFQTMFWIRGGEINKVAIIWVRVWGIAFMVVAVVLFIVNFANMWPRP